MQAVYSSRLLASPDGRPPTPATSLDLSVFVTPSFVDSEAAIPFGDLALAFAARGGLPCR
jgi:hypothetical protein